MKIIGIIPARYKSSRFPGKPLATILGKPMIIWVCERSAAALTRENVYVATDDMRIAETVESYGFNYVMTADNHLTGTDRLAEVARKIDADIYINIQGDEPIIDPKDIIKIKDEKIAYPNLIINGMASLHKFEDPADINIPKVIVDTFNNLIYMSRSSIPAIKSPEKAVRPNYKKQVCIYAFNKKELEAYGQQGSKTPLESFEDIEILRFVELGYNVRMVETSGFSLAVDIPSDIEKVENAIKENGEI